MNVRKSERRTLRDLERPWLKRLRTPLVLSLLGGTVFSAPLAVGAGELTSEDMWKANLAIVKTREKFPEWAGKVKIPGKAIKSLKFSAEDFERFGPGEIKVRTRETLRHRSFGFTVGPTTERGGVYAWIFLKDTPEACHEYLMRRFAGSTSMGRYDKRADEVSGLSDIGDVCYYVRGFNPPGDAVSTPEKPYLLRLLFTRGNVVVGIIDSSVKAEDFMDIPALARFIDQKLVSWLVPVETGGGDPFPKPAASTDSPDTPPTKVDDARDSG